MEKLGFEAEFKALVPPLLADLAHDLFRRKKTRLFIVGGAVRDFLISKLVDSKVADSVLADSRVADSRVAGDKWGDTKHDFNCKSVGDFDVCAPCSLDDLLEVAKPLGYRASEVYGRVGSAKISHEHFSFEFSAFRVDSYKSGIHQPASVAFTTDMRTDALRRDFKMNAIYYDILGESFIDLLGGVDDIRAQIVSTTRSADAVFSEDGLRLMRLARLAAQVNFSVESSALKAAQKFAFLIDAIAPERVFAELSKMLENRPSKAFALLESIGVLGRIFGLDSLNFGESKRDFFADSFIDFTKTHDFSLLDSTLPHLRMARLLLILNAKPEAVFSKLNAPKKFAAHATKLVALTKETSKDSISFIIKNYALIDDFIALTGEPKLAALLENLRAKNAPLTLKELAIKGSDLPPQIKGVNIKTTLESLLLLAAQTPTLNPKEQLLGLLKT